MTVARALALLAALIHLVPFASSQPATQTVRGVVLDRDTQAPLVGATVILADSDPLLGTATDAEGRFVLRGVPLGRQTFRIQYIGYASAERSNVLIGASQESVLEILLSEEVVSGAEVVARASRQGQAQDDMATVSARSFSVEQARRYAGALDDPARLAASFAGVVSSGSGVQDNALAIRGNAPKGVLWRLEGVPIPNPNHFAGLSVAGGGGVTLFSGRLLSNSDVFTGAFPAEYGNALSGVFDMRFRTGNPATREHSIQVGALGVEVASEGPVQLGAPSTYVMNYRYSTIGLLQPLLPTESQIRYQDLSFKMAVPTRRMGRFELWGIGGIDRQSETETPDPTEWEYAFSDRTRYDLDLAVGAGGLSHHLVLGRRTYLRSTAAVTANRTHIDQRFLADSGVLQPDLQLDNLDTRVVLGTTLHHKISPRFVQRAGAQVQTIAYDVDLQAAPRRNPPLEVIAQESGNVLLFEGFAQSRISPTASVDLTLGLHGQHLSLTGATALEPRLGARWAVTPRQSVSLGYGLHSQAEDPRIYLAETGASSRANLDLGFTRAHHLVLGTSRQLSETVRVGLEGYLQRLVDVPVIADSSFSLLNVRQDWTFNDALVNQGQGENLGLELTVERAQQDGLYGLLTASLFRSRYQGGDAIWRPTRFDQGFMLNVLAGQEIRLSDRQLVGVNVRIAALGGERYSPADLDRSRMQEEVVTNETSPFSEQRPAIGLLDVTVTYRVDRRLSHVVTLQLKNALSAKDTWLDYNFQQSTVEEIREGFPLPVLSYTLEL